MNTEKKNIIKSLERKLKQKSRKDFMCNYGIQKVLFRCNLQVEKWENV